MGVDAYDKMLMERKKRLGMIIDAEHEMEERIKKAAEDQEMKKKKNKKKAEEEMMKKKAEKEDLALLNDKVVAEKQKRHGDERC
nr:hypothetical protein [Tanacetum cinerariifolium]